MIGIQNYRYLCTVQIEHVLALIVNSFIFSVRIIFWVDVYFDIYDIFAAKEHVSHRNEQINLLKHQT